MRYEPIVTAWRDNGVEHFVRVVQTILDETCHSDYSSDDPIVEAVYVDR